MPNWIQVGLITVTGDWQHIPQTESKVLRLRRAAPVQFWTKGHIARAVSVDGAWQYWGFRRIYPSPEPIVLDFRNQPPEMEGAILAVRRWQRPQHDWQIAIDAPAYQSVELPLVQCVEVPEPAFGDPPP
jgi:hypothetical protein